MQRGNRVESVLHCRGHRLILVASEALPYSKREFPLISDPSLGPASGQSMVKRPALHLPAPTPAIDSKAIYHPRLVKQPTRLVPRSARQRAQLDADAKRQSPKAT